ncbi:MAG: BMP family protein [Candidatus Pelethousia sp.]|nr:BMP family protein [Candidatus Pelethousia sp.]
MKKLLVLLTVCLLALVVAVGCSATPAVNEEDAQLKVALCVSGPVNDGGFCAGAYEGLLLAEKDLGVAVSYTENVDITDIEAVFTDYASQGYDLIIGHGFQFGDPALKVGEKYPDTKFVCTNANVESENVASYELGGKDGSYVMGALAAYMTKTNKIGMIAGMEGPSQIKIIEGYKLGAKSVNPDIQIFYTFTGSFTDVAKGNDAAVAMIDNGADVIAHCANQAGMGGIKAAQEAGILATGNCDDQYEAAPDTIMCSDVWSTPGLIKAAVQDVLDGKFEGGFHELGMAAGMVDIAPYHNFEDKIPQEVKDSIAKLVESIKTGELEVPSISELTD